MTNIEFKVRIKPESRSELSPDLEGKTMLVLTRKVGQSIVISDDIELLVIEVRGDQVRLGIEAPRKTPIMRKELLEQIETEAPASD